MGARLKRQMQAPRRGSGPVLSLALILLLLAGAPARAGALENGGFEVDGLSGWQEAHAPGGDIEPHNIYPTDGSQPTLSAAEGTWFAVLTPGTQDIYTQLTQTFQGAAGEIISCQNFFDGVDSDNPDRAEVLILRDGTPIETVFAAESGPMGSTGLQEWTTWQFSLPENGSYVLEARVSNSNSDDRPSVLGMDACTITSPTLAAQFSATASNGRNILTWQTSGETDIIGFNLMRAVTADGPYVPVNPSLIPSQGSTGGRYSYTDAPGAGEFYYRLNGISTTSEERQLGSAHLSQPLSPFRRPLRQPAPPRP